MYQSLLLIGYDHMCSDTLTQVIYLVEGELSTEASYGPPRRECS